MLVRKRQHHRQADEHREAREGKGRAEERAALPTA